MTTTIPTVNDDDRLCLSEAARILGVTRVTVRANYRRYDIYPHVNLRTRRTIFTGKQVKQLWYVMQ